MLAAAIASTCATVFDGASTCADVVSTCAAAFDVAFGVAFAAAPSTEIPTAGSDVVADAPADVLVGPDVVDAESFVVVEPFGFVESFARDDRSSRAASSVFPAPDRSDAFGTGRGSVSFGADFFSTLGSA